MRMRIVLPDAASAGALGERLAISFGSERISVLEERREVDVQVEGESDRAVIRIVDAVERWLDHAAGVSAEMILGENSYRLSRWAGVETRR